MNLDHIRDQLRAKVGEILDRNAKVEGNRRRERTPLGSDWAENAILLENDEVLEALDGDGRARIAQLSAALARIEAGTYGRCATCGGEIAPERLEALPEVTVCIACARSAEQSVGGPKRR
jgi:RNA polymerase-binding transcription factor DksA